MSHSGHKCTLMLAAAALLLLVQLPAAQARISRAAIACSMYVSPCHCGLCHRIVDCVKNPTAECFCGTASPGIYPHLTDTTKFWMCSFDTQSHIPYGVEVACPARLVFDSVLKVCTVPAAVSPAPLKTSPGAATPPASAGVKTPAAQPTPTPTNKPNGDVPSTAKVATTSVKGAVVSEDSGVAFLPSASGTLKVSSSKKP